MARRGFDGSGTSRNGSKRSNAAATSRSVGRLYASPRRALETHANVHEVAALHGDAVRRDGHLGHPGHDSSKFPV